MACLSDEYVCPNCDGTFVLSRRDIHDAYWCTGTDGKVADKSVNDVCSAFVAAVPGKAMAAMSSTFHSTTTYTFVNCPSLELLFEQQSIFGSANTGD